MKTTCAWLALALAAAAEAAQAQPGKWPDKPVRIIVPFPPGGTTDIVARSFAPLLSQEHGQQFVVDNRAGAGGAIGAEIAARANPDGYTIAVVTSSYAATAVLHKLPYDPVKGIAPISMIGMLPFLLAVHPSVKAGKVRALAVAARERSPAMPDLPPVGETVPGYAVDGWAGMWTPAGTPQEIISRLNRSVARILKQSDVQERLRVNGAEPLPSTPERFAQIIANDIGTWSRVVKAGNIKIE